MAKPVEIRDFSLLADEDLMHLVSRGDAQAFEVLYERHSGPAFSLAYRMVGTRGAAEDVVQEAFINLWRSGARYERSRGSVRTWLLGIVHHRAIDALRRSTTHDKRRTSDEGIEERLEAKERTHDEAARREEGRGRGGEGGGLGAKGGGAGGPRRRGGAGSRSQRDGDAAGRPVPGDRA